MKRKIFKWFFKSEYLAYEREMKCMESKSEKKIQKMKEELCVEEKKYGLVKSIFTDDKNSKIVALDTNRNGEDVLVVESFYDNNLWIKLYGPSYSAVNKHPRIMSTIKKDIEKGITYIHIDDIDTIHINCGNGSIAMKYFLKAAETTGAEYINGSLSSKDKDHFPRSEHYYKKFGFEVNFNEGRTSGGVKLYLKWFCKDFKGS